MKDFRRMLPPYVHPEYSRHGKRTYYFRKGHGKRTPLPDTFPSQEFNDAYQACLASTSNTKQVRSKSKEHSLRWLVEKWRESSEWTNTAPATKRQRENILVRILKNSGDENFRQITSHNIRDGREDRKTTPSAANNFLKVMRALFRWAKEEQLIDSDPTKDVKFLKVKTKGFPPWVMEEVSAYRQRWPLGTRQRLAFELLLNTGLRRSDVVRVGPQHVRDGIIHLRAKKNDVELHIPILPQLATAIAAGPTGEMSFLSSQYGRPLTKESFGNIFRPWCTDAGVKKSAHGLRKLAATAVANNGGSEQQLQALFGWTTNTMSAVYTRDANRQRQALQAAFKLQQELEQNETSDPEAELFLPAPLAQLPAPSKKN